MKESICSHTEQLLPDLWAISKELYDHPELGQQEINASRLLREWLRANGFFVEENFQNLPTAFRAVYGSGKPVIGFVCEYDALPEIGHGCGHNLICAMSAGAAVSLKDTVDTYGGTIIVYGTPDEEVAGCKVQLANAGAFNEVDVALMAHPGQRTYARMGSMGIYPIQFEFYGKKCHAAQVDHGCVNALDAAATAYVNINQLKQYLDANIYGIINHGGDLPNIIPDYASLQYYIRCDAQWKTNLAVERVTRCAQGAADGVGATLKVTSYLAPFKGLLLNKPLYETMEKNFQILGVPFCDEISMTGSTDMGDVSFKVPAIHAMIGLDGCENMAMHTKEFAAQTVEESGRNATRVGVCALAQTAYDIITSPDLLSRIKTEFDRTKKVQEEKNT